MMCDVCVDIGNLNPENVMMKSIKRTPVRVIGFSHAFGSHHLSLSHTYISHTSHKHLLS